MIFWHLQFKNFPRFGLSMRFFWNSNFNTRFYGGDNYRRAPYSVSRLSQWTSGCSLLLIILCHKMPRNLLTDVSTLTKYWKCSPILCGKCYISLFWRNRAQWRRITLQTSYVSVLLYVCSVHHTLVLVLVSVTLLHHYALCVKRNL